MSLWWHEPGIVPRTSRTARSVLVVVGSLAFAAGPLSAREARAECRCRRADSNHHAGPATARPRPMGDALQAKIFFVTLAVDDLGRSVAFYGDGSGWPAEGIVGPQVARAAVDAGLSTSEVHRLAGMARTTIDRIAGTIAAMEADPR